MISQKKMDEIFQLNKHNYIEKKIVENLLSFQK
jgi:hypothetical protein